AGIFLRDFLLKNNLYMNEKMSAQEDTLFYYEFEQKSKKIYKWEVPCYLYRQRTTSVMHVHDEKRNKQYYLAMVEMLRVYQEYKANGIYLDLSVLEHKIHHSKQNIATCLASITDKKYIKEQLKWLKTQKIYPYKFRKDALRGEGSLLKKLLVYLMPLKLFFWLYHWIYQKSRK
ncbi:MAG: hypothetical protein IKA40_00555, partial [Clostridia bacterium]|nr:hypothetical protein [Clostridia bacterium]